VNEPHAPFRVFRLSRELDHLFLNIVILRCCQLPIPPGQSLVLRVCWLSLSSQSALLILTSGQAGARRLIQKVSVRASIQSEAYVGDSTAVLN
jgi:hypothetical protein